MILVPGCVKMRKGCLWSFGWLSGRARYWYAFSARQVFFDIKDAFAKSWACEIVD